jgi:RTX calcium-binding nonapeptide repeat (4 copies)
MLGLVGLLGAIMASLSMDVPSDEEGSRDGEDAAPETEGWGVSTAFMEDEPIPVDPPLAPAGADEQDGLPQSNDSQDLPDPDLTLMGNEGNDALQGQDGADSLAGGDGDDSLWGNEGNDTLTGDAGDDALAGCEGDDSAVGGDGKDSVIGGTGDDELDGQAGDDLVDGGTGHDVLAGGTGADEVEGGAGNDTLSGGQGAEGDTDVDFLNGGYGDDELHLAASDFGNGGQGADSFVLQDFAPGQPVVQITDFDPAEDQLVVMYDATLHPAPELTVGSGGGATILMLDGVPLASLTNGAVLDVAAVQLQAA